MTRRRGRLDPAYLIGAWLPLYIPWISGTVIGVLMGAQVPLAWRHPLEAIFPIVFLTLTVLVCTSPALAVVAVLGGVLSVLFALWLPVGWNVLAAGVLASAFGPAIEARLRSR
jgi:predicted branched-subunit amino acid permease